MSDEKNPPPHPDLRPAPDTDAERIRIGRMVWRIGLSALGAESAINISLLSQIETGRRPLTPELRRRILCALARLIDAQGKAA